MRLPEIIRNILYYQPFLFTDYFLSLREDPSDSDIKGGNL